MVPSSTRIQMEPEKTEKESLHPGLIVLAALFGLFLLYLLAMTFSRGKVDDFCASITPTTKMSDLHRLAANAGVGEFRIIEIDKPNGKILYAAARDLWSGGAYGCRVRGRADTQEIISKTLGANSLSAWQRPPR